MLTIADAQQTRSTLYQQVKRHTPWGIADFATSFGPGLISYSTPSHGGFYVEHLDQMPACLQKASDSYCGFHWFEEDCEASLVVVAHPAYFTPDERFRALGYVATFYPTQYAAYLLTDHYREHGKGAL